ncbi:hypothetical protein F4677DRAFT_444196 [Hypoxylon crocopeplum]|nr:hypothetical protein F4677DRAFT_444196 [Hypoxylon crocopeplum]
MSTQQTEVVTPREQSYFVLEQKDIYNLRTCLGRLHQKGLWKDTADKEILQGLETIAVLNRRRFRALGLPDTRTYAGGILTEVPYWINHKCDPRFQPTMFEYGEWMGMGPTEPKPDEAEEDIYGVETMTGVEDTQVDAV